MSAPPQTPASQRPYTRSGKPAVWVLFGAGGTLAALFGPVLVLVTVVLAPLGLLPPGALGYARVLAFVQWWPGKLALLALVGLLAFHAMFRVYHGLHDLGLGSRSHRLDHLLCYGFASLCTAVCALLLWRA